MTSPGTITDTWRPAIEADRQAVRDQLERILSSHLFRNSKRYPALLRYVVEHALDGHTEQVKERTLGIEVFGRDPNYDTNLDPVVRTTAGEIRKRIAQYYHENGHEAEILIDLPCGSYIPEFRLRTGAALAPATVAPATVAPAAIVLPAPPATVPAFSVPRRVAFAFGILLVVAAGVSAWRRPWQSRTSFDRFWAPVIEASGPAFFSVGQPSFTQTQGPEQQTPDLSTSWGQLVLSGKHYVALSDAMAMARMAGLLQSRGKDYHIRGGVSTSFSDLQDGPVILIGAFNNEWTLRLTENMRFSFHRDSPVLWIEDSQTPARRDWTSNRNTPYLKLEQDYALVTRVKDPTTQRIVVVAAGLLSYGTTAAGEFLSDPRYLEEFARTAPAGWDTKNVQIVIATKVIDGNSGPPRIVASHLW